VIGTPAVPRPHWASSARTAVLLGVAVLALSSCTGGAIGANEQQSSGKSFVSSSYSSKYLDPGSRPAAPSVTGTTLTGQRFSLAAQRGDVVVMNFWGSWCAPCRNEAPSLAQLARHFAGQPVHFMGDNELDSPASAKAFEHTFNIGYPSLNDPGGEVALAFHGTLPPTAIPSTLVIDRTGHIAAIVVGGVSYDGLKGLISRVLAEKPTAGT
jgi:peroxiredoxin